MNRVLFLFLLLPAIGKAQDFDSVKFEYTHVGNTQGDARVLQSRARTYVYDHFADPHAVTALDDVDGGIFIFFNYMDGRIDKKGGKQKTEGYCSYTVRMTFRRQSYKIVIQHVQFSYFKDLSSSEPLSGDQIPYRPNASTLNGSEWLSVKKNAALDIQKFADALNDAMTSDELNPDADSF